MQLQKMFNFSAIKITINTKEKYSPQWKILIISKHVKIYSNILVNTTTPPVDK